MGLAGIATRQHGVISTAQLVGVGLTEEALRHRARVGRLHRVHRGVYAVGYIAPSDESRWMAAVLACGRKAALSHTSAAKLWGIWRGAESGTHVVVPGCIRGPSAVHVHRSRTMAPSDQSLRGGIPVTTVSRTIVDLASMLTAEQLANVIHEAAYRRLLSVRGVRAALRRTQGRRWNRRVEAALEAHLTGSSGTRSTLEDRLLSVMSSRGIPPPAVNRRLSVSGSLIEVDFVWPQAKLCVEIDGPAHDRPRTKREDRLRDSLLRSAGYEVVRLRAEHLDQDGYQLAAEIEELLHRRLV